MAADVSARVDATSVPGRGPLAPRLAALKAARELVTERGFSVGVRDIAAAAGIDHAVVIRYFGSKAGLLDAVLATDCNDLLGDVGEPSESGRGLLMVRQARAGRSETLLIVRAGLDGRRCDDRPLPVVKQWADALNAEQAGKSAAPLLSGRGAAFVAIAVAAGYAVLEPYERTRIAHDYNRREVDAYVGQVLDDLLALPSLGSLPGRVSQARARRATPATSSRPEATGPPPRGREEVKQAILDAAVDLFASHEIGAVSVRTIAKRARVNHSLLFRHFGSKEGVLQGAIKRAADEVDKAFASVTSTNDLVDVVRLIRGDSRLIVLMAQALLSGYAIEESQHEFPPAARRLVSLLEQDSARSSSIPPVIVAICVTSLLFGSVLFEKVLRAGTGLPADTDVDALVTDAAFLMFDL
jgi:TetR/AcrR family transcriptional regulator, repressor for neighboring sulfatase